MHNSFPLHSLLKTSGIMSSKAALKAIADAVRQQKFDDVIEKAREFLKKEPNNYQGYVGHSTFKTRPSCAQKLTPQSYFLGFCVG